MIQLWLSKIAEFNRCQQQYPGRWKICNWLESHSETIREFEASPQNIGKGVKLYIDPKDFSGVKDFIYGINPFLFSRISVKRSLCLRAG